LKKEEDNDNKIIMQINKEEMRKPQGSKLYKLQKKIIFVEQKMTHEKENKKL